MRLWTLIAAVALFQAGCTHLALERHSLNQVGTVSDLRYRLVLDNLAVNAGEPSAIPFHSILSGGGTTITDSRDINPTTVINAMAFDNQSIALDTRRDIAENWTLDPIYEPEKLTALRSAYCWALCGPEQVSPECMEELRKFGVLDRLRKIPPGWLSAGGRRDVPKCVCYVSHWKGKYVWVEPSGMAALSQFALVIQDIATTDLNSLGGPTKTVTVEEYKYDGNKVVLVTKTTRTVSDDDKTATGTELPKARIDYRVSDSRLRSLLYQ